MKNFNVKKLVIAAVIAAIYAVLTIALAPLSYGAVQIRFSEALTVLPFFMPGSAVGLAVGCLISNIYGGFGLPDIIFGTLATLSAGFVTSKIKNKWLAPLPPVVFNAVIIGAIIAWYEVGFTDAFMGAFGFNMLTVGLGQIGACYVLGMILIYTIERVPALNRLFKS